METGQRNDGDDMVTDGNGDENQGKKGQRVMLKKVETTLSSNDSMFLPRAVRGLEGNVFSINFV